MLRADECRVVFRFYTSRRKYQQALARGGARCDLDGNIAGEVAPDQIDAAKAKLAIIDARLKERAKAKARTRSTLPPPPPPPSALEAPRRLSLADLKRAAQERRQAEAGR